MLIDTHAHLQHPRFAENPTLTPAQLVANFQAAGVSHTLTIACRRSEWPPALALAAEFPQQVSVVAGIHPQDVAAEPPVTTAELLALTTNPQIVALGETGLDYFYENSPKAAQQASFHTHLHAAAQANLPVVIHTRSAEADTIAILQEHRNVPFVLHCFTGTPWLAEQALELGGFLSFSGILTFKKSHELRSIAQNAPKNRILIETDAPYLAPEPHRSQRNQPALIVHTAQCLADVWQTSLSQVSEITTENAQSLFRLK